MAYSILKDHTKRFKLFTRFLENLVKGSLPPFPSLTVQISRGQEAGLRRHGDPPPRVLQVVTGPVVSAVRAAGVTHRDLARTDRGDDGPPGRCPHR
jgi:hypothetical protein